MITLIKALIPLLLVAVTSSSNIERQARDLQINELTFRLPGTVKPSIYTVILFIDPNNHDSFSGSVTIRFKPDTQTNIIALHALAISVNTITLAPVGSTQPIGVSEYLVDDARQFLRVITSSLLNPETEYDITITYVGQYADNMFGVYFSSYPGYNGATNYLVATQFQPTFARRAFPCFDEPHLKAIFRVSIYAPPEFETVLGNTEEIDSTGRLITLIKALIPLLLVAVTSSSNIERQARDLQINELTFRLPGTVKPSIYTVILFIDPNNHDSFSGSVTIRFKPDTQTNIIALHALAISVNTITLAPVGSTQPIGVSEYLVDDARQFLRVITSSLLNPETEYDITITYVGQYADNMFGVYFSSYPGYNGATNYLVATQFQPTFARRAFPCFDEPHLKAIFRVSIYAPPEFETVLGNTEEIDSTGRLPFISGFDLHEFADTVEMSTYLVAFVVSNFVSIGNKDDGEEVIYDVPFRVYTRAGGEESARFALEFGQQSMVALQEYTEMKYALGKLDKIGLPDFAAGAMENWGLVTYREIALLYVEGVTTTINLQTIGRIISHENMHMWFGNEVSPAWWNYLWLNEGFANLFEYYATDMVRPDWRMMDQYVVSIVQNVFQNDAVKNVNPMTTDVFAPTEILGNFNAVAYQKSGSVIRMLQHVMTSELFRQGLVNYLKTHVRDVATAEDLYAALQPYTPVNVTNFMNSWVNNPGFPVLTITRDAPNANSVTIFQHRYYTDPSIVERGFWTVPLNWALSSDPNFTDTSPQDWLPVMWLHSLSLDMPGLAGSKWYIFNKQQTGYYRVNYDEQNWIDLGVQLNIEDYESIHLLNRAQLVDDSLNLARTERLSYAIAFDIVKYLIQEPDYIPWQSGFNAFTYLHNALADTEALELFQNFVMEISEPIYSRLGFIVPADEEHVANFHRNIAINMNCRYGNQNCINEALELLGSLIAGEINNIHPDIQIVVFCSALRGGSSDHFNVLWTRYLAATESSEEIVLLNALGCTSNEDNLNTYLSQAIDPNSEVRPQDRHTIITSVINSGAVNAERAFSFFLDNFEQLQDNIQGLAGTRAIIEALAVVLHTEEHLNKFEEFAAAYRGSLSASEKSGIDLAMETIAATIAWRQENVLEIQSWLESHFDLDDDEEDDDGNGSEPVVATAMFILFSFLAAVHIV